MQTKQLLKSMSTAQRRSYPHRSKVTMKKITDFDSFKEQLGSFVTLYVDSIKTAPLNRSALLFAIIATLTGTSVFALFQKGAPLAEYGGYVNSTLSTSPLFSLAILLSMCFSVFSTGAMTLSLADRKITAASKESYSVLLRQLGIEILFLLSALLGLYVLLSPSLLIAKGSGNLSQGLFYAGCVLYIPIFVVLSLTREFTTFQILLSKLTVKASVRLGYRLVTKKLTESIIFGLLFLLFATVSALIMEPISYALKALPFDSVIQTTAIVVISLLIQALFLLIGKAAWLSFFLKLNTDDSKESAGMTSQDDEKVIQR